MNRRAYLTSLAASTAMLSGCNALWRSYDDSQPGYIGQTNIVSDHPDLTLRLLQETIHLGDTIEFEVTNTRDSDVELGCHNPWAIQYYADDEWQHVTWTGERYYDLCLTRLTQGSSLVESLTLAESELETQAAEVQQNLTPGRYRFLLIGPSPYVTIEFDVLDPE